MRQVHGAQPFRSDDPDSERIWWSEVGVHQNDDLNAIPPGEPILVFPGSFGGILTPMAYAEGVVYVPVVNLGTFMSPVWSGGFNLADGTGELVAVTVDDGIVLWSKRFDSMVFGGATVVNDLVFTSTFDGMIYALDRETGDEIWVYQAPTGINGWPAVADDMIIVPAGVGSDSQPPVLIAFQIGSAD